MANEPAKLAPIHIFRAGRHTASNGTTLDFSDADLAAAAAAYDPALHEAPIVVGHPRDDAPAYGWVAGLTYDDAGLAASPQQVDPAFAEMVRDGRFKKVSASFYTPDSKTNPAPGAYYLRHVGFLGAQPPSVKGLRPVAFADGAEGVIEVEFAEGPEDALWNRFTSWLLGRIDRETAAAFAEISMQPWSGDASRWKDADAYCEACLVDTNASGQPKIKGNCHLPVHEPSGELNRHALIAAEGALVAARRAVDLPEKLKAAAARKLIPLLKQARLTPVASLVKLANFTEPTDEDTAVDDKDKAARDAAFAERETAIKAREDAIAASEAKARNAANAEFIETLVKAGKLLPRDQAGMTAFVGALATDAVVTFSEGNDEVKKPAIEWLRGFLTNLAPAVDYKEHAKSEGAASNVVSFAAPPGTIVDPARAETYAKAKAFQAANPNTDWLSAVRAVGG